MSIAEVLVHFAKRTDFAGIMMTVKDFAILGHFQWTL